MTLEADSTQVNWSLGTLLRHGYDYRTLKERDTIRFTLLTLLTPVEGEWIRGRQREIKKPA